MDLGQRTASVKSLISDRAGQFTGSFDAVFTAAGVRILASPPQAPRTNAICVTLNTAGTRPGGNQTWYPCTASRAASALAGLASHEPGGNGASPSKQQPAAHTEMTCQPTIRKIAEEIAVLQPRVHGARELRAVISPEG